MRTLLASLEISLSIVKVNAYAICTALCMQSSTVVEGPLLHVFSAFTSESLSFSALLLFALAINDKHENSTLILCFLSTSISLTFDCNQRERSAFCAY